MASDRQTLLAEANASAKRSITANASAKDLLPLDIELVIDESVDEKEEEPET
jgi:hypothetical protein